MAAPDATLLADPSIPPAAKLVYMTLPSSRDAASDCLNPATIASKLGLCRDTVTDSLKRLEAADKIQRAGFHPGGNHHKLYFAVPSPLAPVPSPLAPTDKIPGDKITGIISPSGTEVSPSSTEPVERQLIIFRPEMATGNNYSGSVTESSIIVPTPHIFPNQVHNQANHIALEVAGQSEVQTGERSEPSESATNLSSAFQSVPLKTLLCIDPSTTLIGWTLFGPGPARLASGSLPVEGTYPKDRIRRAGVIVAELIAQRRPAAILLENPDFTALNDPSFKLSNFQTFIAGVKQIEAAITASNLPLYRLGSSRHFRLGSDHHGSKKKLKEINLLWFNSNEGRAGTEDEADAYRLGLDFYLTKKGQEFWHGPADNSPPDDLDFDCSTVDPAEADYYGCDADFDLGWLAFDNDEEAVSVSPHPSPLLVA